ncbi:hypothetical protein GGF32_003852 [Allomyces javanicus]|nr:hypothetical protein GGF32_003852 [Allomyces javanicus]
MLRTTLRLSAARRTLATAAGSNAYVASLLNVPKTVVTRLDNGLTVATESHPAASTATVGVWVDAGSRHETKASNGAAHLFQHLAFKGTAKRSQAAIEAEVESLGGDLLATTQREQSALYAQIAPESVEASVALLGDVVSNASLDAAALDAQRAVVAAEAKAVSADAERVVMDHLHAASFQDSSLGFTTHGPLANVQAMTQTDVAHFVKNNFTADRMVLVGAGNVEHAALVDYAKKHFAGVPTTGVKPRAEKPQFVGSDVRLRSDYDEVAHIALAVEGAGWTSADHLPLLVASRMIGKWSVTDGNAYPSTKLAQIALKHHLAESIKSFTTTYSDTGLWGIYLTSKNSENLDDLVHFTIREWMHLCLAPSEGQLAQAKQQVKAEFLRAQAASTTATAQAIGEQVLAYGRRISPFEFDKKIDAITVDDIKRVAHEYIYDADVSIVAAGPVDAVQDYNRIRGAMNLLRF